MSATGLQQGDTRVGTTGLAQGCKGDAIQLLQRYKGERSAAALTEATQPSWGPPLAWERAWGWGTSAPSLGPGTGSTELCHVSRGKGTKVEIRASH